MSLEVTVAAPFRSAGTDRLERGKFVVALSLDRDWFSPDQAKRLVDIATGRGLLAENDGDLLAQFDPTAVEVPEEFTPTEDVLREQSAFERALDAIVADGLDKREAVAAVNERQRELGVTAEAAAVVFARQRGVEVDAVAREVRENLAEASGSSETSDASDTSAATEGGR
ncbi:MAG: DUF2240 family protein [Halolamina sp.]